MLKASHDLSMTVGEIGRIDTTLTEIARQQELVSAWIAKPPAASTSPAPRPTSAAQDRIQMRIVEFLEKIRHEGIADHLASN